MHIYLLTSFGIIFYGLTYEYLNDRLKIGLSKKRLPSYFFSIPIFILLFFISSFRGDFTADYKGYTYLFKVYNQFEFFEVFKAGIYQETGYLTLSRFIGLFTTNEVYLFSVTSFMIVYAFLSQFTKYSSYMWLSVLMFVTVGAYYTSFNIMRQILAVAIVFYGSKYLYDRNFIKFLAFILMASLFHKSSLVMIPFYFILNFKFSFKNIISFFSAAVVAMLYLNDIVRYVQSSFYTAYNSNAYGMTGLSLTNAVLPVSILIFTIIHNKKIDQNNEMLRIWANGVIFYALFSILGLKVQMVQRLSEFFAPYALLLVPYIFSKMKKNELKALYFIGLVLTLVFYNFLVLSDSGYDPYYFIWSKK